tara:strand:- start:62 stop:277 length:216 start_codon:yes stop_codon:yes gene_type:complete
VTELTEIGGINKVLQGNMEGGKEPSKRQNAPYFWTVIRDESQRKQSNPQYLPEITSVSWQILERENGGFSK